MYAIPEEVTAISFDIWKTLLNSRGSFTWPRLELVFGHPAVGILGDFNQEQITDAYKVAEKSLNGQTDNTGIDTGMAERIEKVYRLLGVDKPVPGQQVIDDLQRESGALRMQEAFRPTLTEPDLLETLQALKAAGYTLGSLSNTGMGDCQMVRPIFEYYGLDELLDVRMFSCEDADGYAKPNPSFFRRMAMELYAFSGQVLHIGDNARADYYGARSAGMWSVHYAPEGSDLLHISSMRELLAPVPVAV